MIGRFSRSFGPHEVLFRHFAFGDVLNHGQVARRFIPIGPYWHCGKAYPDDGTVGVQIPLFQPDATNFSRAQFRPALDIFLEIVGMGDAHVIKPEHFRMRAPDDSSMLWVALQKSAGSEIHQGDSKRGLFKDRPEPLLALSKSLLCAL